MARSTLKSSDHAIIGSLLRRAKEGSKLFEGEYQAPWLLSPTIFCDVWSLEKAGGETRIVDGVLRDDVRFDWRFKLPDGTTLTDECNTTLRHALQRIGFVARAGENGPDTLTTHLGFLYSTVSLARWMILQDGMLEPRIHAFSRLTHEHFRDLIQAISGGGLAFALRCPQRFLKAIYPLAVGRDPTPKEMEAPFDLDAADCKRVRAWFEEHGHMRKEFRTVTRQSRIKIGIVASIVCTETQTLSTNPKFRAFLSQFDVGPLGEQQGTARGIADTQREFASHRSKPAWESAQENSTAGTPKAVVDNLRMLVAQHRHLPDICPDPSEFRSRELLTLGERLTRAQKGTPWVPLQTALAYTTEALRWVHVYGEPLVDVFLQAFQALHEQELMAPPPEGSVTDQTDAYRKALPARERVLAAITIPEALKPLNIGGWESYLTYRGDSGFNKLRTAPSMRDAIMVFVASVVVVVGTMKPMRDSELRRLKASPVSFVKGDGFWLDSGQKKRSVSGVDPTLSRPIPAIAATALRLLRRLTDGMKQIIGVTDEWLMDTLFTLPLFGRYEAKIDSAITPIQLATLLDAFCDYVDLPPDSLGRRWYVRVHELRKSFLISFFWTYKYANLQAAAWMAGHADAEEVYAYIRANFPGEELSSLEAQYASEVLRSGPTDALSTEVENIEALRTAVCEHFESPRVPWRPVGLSQAGMAACSARCR